MPGMFNLAYVLQLVIHSLYHRSFPQHALIAHRHKAIFHIVPDTRDHTYITDKENLGKLFGDVAFVGEELAEYRPEEAFVLQWLLSSTFAWEIEKFNISPPSFITMCSLKP